MRTHHLAIVALACAGAIAEAPAQQTTPIAGVIPYEVRDLAPGVFAVVRHPPRGAFAEGNSLVVINDEDVVVVDANILPTSARETIAEIRKRTTKPVRYVVNTHFHSDHHYGNATFRQAYPGVEFVQHAQTRADIIALDIPVLPGNLKTAYPNAAAETRRTLATGRTAQGDTLTPQMRAFLTASLKTYEAFIADMTGTDQIPGTLTVNDSLVLHRGARRIVIKHLGLGNTAGDLVVHLPDERIVATGDLVVRPVPFAFSSHLGSWPTTLRSLEGLGATQIVPGHGEVMTDWTYVHGLIRLIESTWSQVTAAVRAGNDLAAIQKAVNIDSLRSVFPGVSAGTLNAMFLTPGIQSAFADLTADSLAIFGDEGRVLDVIHGFFAAMRRKDTATVRTLFAPNARLMGIRRNADGNARLQALTWAQFAQAIVSDTRPEWIERAFRPQVRIRGTLADVWTEYDFHFGRTPSHCGVDSFQLLKIAGDWKIVSIADTYETAGCPSREPPQPS